jgi:putative endonuclease
VKEYYIYILMNDRTLSNYTGVTNDLIRRVSEHRQKLAKGFAEQYNLDKLVYYEQHSDIHSALNREKEIKGWRREKKLDLIRSLNPEFRDLFDDLKS